MIWQCADCGHQVVHGRRPAACRFCGPDVDFFVASARKPEVAGRTAGHPGVWSRRTGRFLSGHHAGHEA